MSKINDVDFTAKTTHNVKKKMIMKKKSQVKPIFKEDFINEHLDYFQLSQVDGIESKKEILNDWLQRKLSGNLAIQNETAIQADFLNDIFGTILGYNYRNPQAWNLEKELKNNIDGKKPDGAIGFFNLSSIRTKNVHGVIELKSPKTDLDKAQNRINDKRTPVEQAFSYTAKYGKKCKWVIVSNFDEIRLYRSDDADYYEVFDLEGLQKEINLKRFFYFMQIGHLIAKEGASLTERLIITQEEGKRVFKTSRDESHLLEQIYLLIKKFDGVSYVNPNIIANAKPFNSINRHVWHYHDFHLQSSEHGMFNLFKGISVKSGEVLITEELINELKDEVSDYRVKINYIIKRFNDFGITAFQCYKDPDVIKKTFKNEEEAEESMAFKMQNSKQQLQIFPLDLRTKDGVCDCIHCRYNRLELAGLLTMMKTNIGTPQHNTLKSAYLHALFGTDSFKTSFLIYKNIAEKEFRENDFIYFLAKKNMLMLHNLVRGNYRLKDKHKIMSQIKAIDLDRVLHISDIIDTEKKKVILEIKEDAARHRAEEKIEEVIIDAEKVKASLKRGTRGSFPYNKKRFLPLYYDFYAHYSKNYIIANLFMRYKRVCRKLLDGYLLTYTTEDFYGATKELGIIQVNIIIFNLFPRIVQEIFDKHKISEIILSDKAKEDLLIKASNFFKSNHTKSTWGTDKNSDLQKALTSHVFRQNYRHIFTNLLFLLGRTELTKVDCQIFVSDFNRFLEVDETVFSSSLESVRSFVDKHGVNFSGKELIHLLKIITDTNKLNYGKLTKSICNALYEFHPDDKINDEFYIKRTILSIQEKRADLSELVPFWFITNERTQALIEEALATNLKERFSLRLYQTLLSRKILKRTTDDFLDTYLEKVNRVKGSGKYKLEYGAPFLDNYEFVNFAYHLYNLPINLTKKRLAIFTNLCDWQEWILSPETFDYSKFKTEWLFIFEEELFLKKFSEIPWIKEEIENSLRSSHNTELSEIYTKYFL